MDPIVLPAIEPCQILQYRAWLIRNNNLFGLGVWLPKPSYTGIGFREMTIASDGNPCNLRI